MNATERIELEAQLARVARMVLARTTECLCVCHEEPPGKGILDGDPTLHRGNKCPPCRGSGGVPVRAALTDALWKKCPCAEHTELGALEINHIHPLEVCKGICNGSHLIPRTFADFGSGEFSGRVGRAVGNMPALKMGKAIVLWDSVLVAAQSFDDPATLNALEKALKGVKS